MDERKTHFKYKAPGIQIYFQSHQLIRKHNISIPWTRTFFNFVKIRKYREWKNGDEFDALSPSACISSIYLSNSLIFQFKYMHVRKSYHSQRKHTQTHTHTSSAEKSMCHIKWGTEVEATETKSITRGENEKKRAAEITEKRWQKKGNIWSEWKSAYNSCCICAAFSMKALALYVYDTELLLISGERKNNDWQQHKIEFIKKATARNELVSLIRKRVCK